MSFLMALFQQRNGMSATDVMAVIVIMLALSGGIWLFMSGDERQQEEDNWYGCKSIYGGYQCTRQQGHPGKHHHGNFEWGKK